MTQPISSSDVLNEQMQVPTPVRKNRRIFWFIVAMCSLPYLLSTLYYLFRQELPLPHANNKGELITPVRPVGVIPMQDLNGQSFSSQDLLGKWLLVSVSSAQCAEQCQKNIYFMRQMRLALGEDRKRIERLFVLSDTQQLDVFKQQVQNGYQDMRVAVAPAASVQQWQTLLKNPNPVATDGIYIVDPLGNFMMSYPVGFDPALIIKDLRRLLKVSQIG